MNDKTAFSILIVDDEEFVRHLLSSFLSAKYDCLTAENAKQALATLETNHVDLVVTDIMMPGISGLDLCDALRQRYPQTRAIVISALGDGPSREAARERGAFDFIEKPFDLNLILSVVDRALRPLRPQIAAGDLP
jgi:DNA-binding NtrC family response regulator